MADRRHNTSHTHTARPAWVPPVTLTASNRLKPHAAEGALRVGVESNPHDRGISGQNHQLTEPERHREGLVGTKHWTGWGFDYWRRLPSFPRRGRPGLLSCRCTAPIGRAAIHGHLTRDAPPRHLYPRLMFTCRMGGRGSANVATPRTLHPHLPEGCARAAPWEGPNPTSFRRYDMGSEMAGLSSRMPHAARQHQIIRGPV